MYDRIRNPETNRYVSIYKPLGKKIIQNYLYIVGGGDVDCVDNICNLSIKSANGKQKYEHNLKEYPVFNTKKT